MRAVDTNILVRLMIGDDARQVSLAEDFVAKGAWVSLLALAETMWVLASVYQRDASDVAAAVDKLVHHEMMTLQDSDVVTAALELFRRRPSLGFSDCLSLEVARRAGHLPLGTFDRNLGKIDGAQKL